MSAIDGLIAEFCPDGVEYRKLGDLFETFTGKTPKKTDASMYGSEYPFYKPGDFEHGFTAFETDDMLSETGFAESRHVKPGSTLVTCIASLGKIAFAQKEGACNQQINVIPPTEDMNSRFVFHYCCSTWFQSVLWKKANHSNVPNLSLAGFNTIEIPVPPVEVQREVVRILDAFAALTDELTAELAEEVAARKEQFAHYRDRLLSRESLEAMDGKPVEMVRLGDVCNIQRGASPRPIKKFVTKDPDGVPWIKIGDVSTDGKYISCTQERITPDGAAKSRLLHAGDFVLSNSMSWGRPYILKIDGCIHDGWLSLSNFSNSFNSDFLYHLLKSSSIQRYWEMKINTGSVSNLNADLVKETPIPVPSLATQQKVVDILDRFDALTTSLTDGLPAEIEARKAQYGYYRDRLLDFPRKSGDAA